MSKKISQDQIQQLREKYSSDNHVKVVRNAMIKTNSNELSMDWEKYRKIDHSFSHVISGEMPVTNQKSSGRCWGFAGLNLFRVYLGRKHNLKDFQFSQSYFMFWDKLEKSNYFLESILSTVEENFDSRIVMHLLQTPTEDGGQWDMWKNLINKYGVIPQAEMSESFSSSQSAEMNKMLARKLRENAHDLRKEFSKGASNEALNQLKNSMIEEIFKMLSMHLGTPPKSFNWQVRDKDKKFSRYNNLTPQSFYEDHVGLNLDDYVCLINCPMSNKEYNKVYTVEHLGNVVEGSPIRYLNVESDVMKDASIKSIKDDNPVWFGCDVGKHFHRDLGVMDTDLFDYEMFYSTDFKMNKAERLEYGQSQMTHAMLFTGVDLDNNGKSIKWRVENSWGDKGGNKGYHIMSDDWFDEYNYEVVVHKDYLSDELNDIFQNAEAIPLKPWDPMGALAK
jgi:bleomycin hydrolase